MYLYNIHGKLDLYNIHGKLDLYNIDTTQISTYTSVLHTHMDTNIWLVCLPIFCFLSLSL